MIRNLLAAVAVLAHVASGQQIGSIPEVHPKLQTWKCSTNGGCVAQDTSVVLDALSHPLHRVGNSSVSCGDWNNVCATEEACSNDCQLEGADYAAHGVSTQGSNLILRQYSSSNGVISTMSPRVYLLDESGKNYDMLKLLNQELSFDVDVSTLVCGMNGALYLSEMLQSGGRSDLNPAGAQYGTGYCDAQCFTPSWVNGVANVNSVGACCNEMDIWEANARSTGLTPHACDKNGFYECSGDECGSSGICDKGGCGFNPYALGDHDYYGYQKTVDTTKGFTVVTQFVTDDGTAQGTLAEIRRLYVQGGKVIQNAVVNVSGSEIDSITDGYCVQAAGYFQQKGGLKQMGEAIARGMVLIFSIWNDAGGFMNWLDSGNAGPCNSTEGNPALIEAQHPDTSVTFSKIKWGDIGSTYPH